MHYDMLTLRTFGRLAEIIPITEIGMHGIATTGQLKIKLLESYPEIASVPFSLAVNNRLSPDDFPLNQGDTIALLPPFAGG